MPLPMGAAARSGTHALWNPAVRSVFGSLLAVLALCGVARAQTAGTTATLLWTAPGDDGMSGRASRYELRYRSVAISGTDTTGWWSSASAVPGMPTPGVAGSVDSVTVSGLDPSLTYYFVLRSADEVPNWSRYSNVAVRLALPVADLIPPAAITDLQVAASGTAASPADPSGATVRPDGGGRR